MKRLLLLGLGALCVLPMSIEPVYAETKTVEIGYSVDAKVVLVDGNVTIEADVKCGEAMKEPSHTDKNGYRFLGWYIKGTNTKWNFADPITEDLSLETRFEKIKSEDEDKKDDTDKSDSKNESKDDSKSDSDKDKDTSDKTDDKSDDKNNANTNTNTNQNNNSNNGNDNGTVMQNVTSSKKNNSVNTATQFYIVPSIVGLGISVICLFLIKKKEGNC